MRIREIVGLVLREHRIEGRKSLQSTISHSRALLRYLPAKARTIDIERYKERRLCDHRRKPGTVRNELAILHHGYRLAVEQGLLRPDKVPLIKFPKVVNVRTVCPSIEQFKLLIETLDRIDPKVADYIRWIGLTGWRRGEASDLTWEMVSDDRTKVDLPPRICKNEKMKSVTVGRTAQSLLDKRWIDRYGPYVFHRGGKRIYYYYGPWRKACEAAGIPELHTHDLRRFFASTGIRQRVSKQELKSIAGWVTDSIFYRYCIVDGAMQSQAQDKIAEVIL